MISEQTGTAVAPADVPEIIEPREIEDSQPGPIVLRYTWELWNQRAGIRRIAMYGTILFLVIALLVPNRYTSVTQLMPPEGQNTGLIAALAVRGGETGLGGIAGELLGAKTSGALFVGILRSRTVLMRMVERFDLRKVYWTRSWESAARQLSNDTQISEDRKSGIISIAVTQRDPVRAAQIAHAYVNELDRLSAQLNTTAPHRERVFLEQRLAAVKSELNAAAIEFSQFASKNTAIDIPEQGKAMVQAAARLQGELIAAQSELSGLQQIYAANNVRVRAAEARVNELRVQLRNLGGSDAPAAGDGFGYPSIRQLPILGVKYAELYRDAKIQEAIFEALTKQYEIAKVEEARAIPSVKVLDEAAVPERKSGPARTLIVLSGGLLSLLAGIIWVLSKEAWKQVDQNDPYKQFAMQLGAEATVAWEHVAAPIRMRLQFNRPAAEASKTENPGAREESEN